MSSLASSMRRSSCLGSQFKWKFLTPFRVRPPASIASYPTFLA